MSTLLLGCLTKIVGKLKFVLSPETPSVQGIQGPESVHAFNNVPKTPKIGATSRV